MSGQRLYKEISALVWNAARLDKMSLLKEFYVSVYYTSTNLKNIPFNSFKIGFYFKKQPSKNPNL